MQQNDNLKLRIELGTNENPASLSLDYARRGWNSKIFQIEVNFYVEGNLVCADYSGFEPPEIEGKRLCFGSTDRENGWEDTGVIVTIDDEKNIIAIKDWLNKIRSLKKPSTAQ